MVVLLFQENAIVLVHGEAVLIWQIYQCTNLEDVSLYTQ